MKHPIVAILVLKKYVKKRPLNGIKKEGMLKTRKTLATISVKQAWDIKVSTLRPAIVQFEEFEESFKKGE
jgi:hypothetical protein